MPFSTLTECYNSEYGEWIQLQAEILTNRIQNPLAWVPTTTYHWVSRSEGGEREICYLIVLWIVFVLQIFKQDLTSRSEFGLKEVVCEKLNNSAPICNE